MQWSWLSHCSISWGEGMGLADRALWSLRSKDADKSKDLKIKIIKIYRIHGSSTLNLNIAL